MGEAHLRRALAARPPWAAAAAAQGISLLETGRVEEAERLLAEALDRNPDELRAARALLALKLRKRDHAAARELALHIARSDPRDPAARLAEALRALE